MESKNPQHRRQVIKSLGLAMGAVMLDTKPILAQGKNSKKKPERVLRAAHITDIHISADNDAPNRFRKCLQEIKNHNVDFFLNGGDTIMAADYDHITREQVLEQWRIWDGLKGEFNGIKVHSCLGNHDMWWAAPDRADFMYGKNYVVDKMEMPHRYYRFAINDWFFMVLDSNNANAGSLDGEQRKWFEDQLNELPKGASILVMTHYPILGVSTIPYGGNHTDSKYITKLFHKHQDKKIHCISGHMHLLETATYNNVNYYCNGSMSGFWWGEGDAESAGKYWYHETPPGYSIIDFFNDGSIRNTYFPHSY